MSEQEYLTQRESVLDVGYHVLGTDTVIKHRLCSSTNFL